MFRLHNPEARRLLREGMARIEPAVDAVAKVAEAEAAYRATKANSFNIADRFVGSIAKKLCRKCVPDFKQWLRGLGGD